MSKLPQFSEVKPKLRGVIHEIFFFVSLATGAVLVALSDASHRVGTIVYSVTLSALFGVSALYHRPDWRPEIRKWLRKLDHTMILFLIAGTFTPIAVVLGTTLAKIVLVIVWSGAFLGAFGQLLPISTPKAVTVIPYLAMGWIGLSILPQSFVVLGATVPVLLIVGGIFYTLGAIAYARRRPNPLPGVFGYHEVFHSFVVIAAYCHYAGILTAVF